MIPLAGSHLLGKLLVEDVRRDGGEGVDVRLGAGMANRLEANDVARRQEN